MPDLRIAATVNGRNVARSVRPHARLLDFLRDDLGHTGTKEGCGAGECGTCSVFVDGVLLKSCLVPVAKAQGARIETVEGLAEAGTLSVLQQAFHKMGASQCGYCIPGMVMAATAALRANPFADREEIKERLGGNICRCTGYQKIFDAVELARDVQNGRRPASALAEEEPADGAFIGANVRRIDAPGKVSGALRYAGDMVMPHMLHMAVLRSPLPHARIVALDTSQAEAMPGVAGVITSADVPGVDGFGVFVHDQPIMARGRVRYVGEAVAAVAAEDALTARRALAAIKVTYEPLAAVFDAHYAMRSGAPVLHDYAPDNIVKHIPIRVGNVETGFAASDLIVEETYRTQQVEHAYLEPEAGLAYVDHDGTVTIVSPSQNITHHRHMLSRIVAQPINKVRFIMSPVGGGFGGKEDMIYQGMLAVMAMKTRRPVRLVFAREESIISTAKRHPSHTTCRMGLRRDGRIQAVAIRMVCDGGAYGLSTEGVMRKAAILAAGPYAIANVKVDTYGVYTNNTPSGAFRSFGALQVQFATETHLDICAERLGLDPFEIRRINAMRDGATTHTRQRLPSVSLGRALDGAEQASRWERGAPSSRGAARGDLGGDGVRPPCTLGARLGAPAASPAPGGATARRRGRGMAACWYGIARTATVDRAGAWAELDDGGTAKIVTGVTEIGEGILTVLAQIAAHELGVRPQDVTIGDNDTARSPEAAHAGATRQTYMIGNAVALAARQARAALAEVLAGHWGVDGRTIRAAAGEVWAEGTNHKMPMAEAVQIAKSRGVVPVGAASFGTDTTGLDPVDGSGRPWQAYVFGCQVAEVEVDTLTGEVQVLGIWAAHDVGRAVNPRGVEGQIEGGIVQALGQGLMEDYRTVNGRAATPNLAKYILPTSLDVPHVTSVILEDPDPIGPLGVKGIGEPAMIPTIPAVMNAIYDAVGVRMTSLPATPERVLEGIRANARAAAHRVAAE
jgi:CO/xanthine dehydrogenase Mo-binding subunit/aerobic-type carbon monoxide dehydrogenase small subunit (CoxS/CutS family)